MKEDDEGGGGSCSCSCSCSRGASLEALLIAAGSTFSKKTLILILEIIAFLF